jgi:hypothetical protein
MAETKYGKYIITEIKPKKMAPWDPKFTLEELIPLPRLDSGIVKGAFYVDSGWMLPAFAKELRGESHVHDFDEVIAFFGSDPQNPTDLGAVAEVRIGDEVHTVTKSCLIFVPKGLKHGPIDFKKIDRPIIHFACGIAEKYF